MMFVYELLHRDSAVEQTSYIMQFLWRDLTSSYDIVGPSIPVLEVFMPKLYIHVCLTP